MNLKIYKPIGSEMVLTLEGCLAIFFFMLCLRRAEGVEGLAGFLGVPLGVAPSPAWLGGACPFLTGVLGASGLVTNSVLFC